MDTIAAIATKLRASVRKWSYNYYETKGKNNSKKWKHILKNHFVSDEKLDNLRRGGPLLIGTKLGVEDSIRQTHHNSLVVSSFAQGGTEIVFEGTGAMHLKVGSRLIDESGELAAIVKARLPHDKGAGSVYAHNLRPARIEPAAPLSTTLTALKRSMHDLASPPPFVLTGFRSCGKSTVLNMMASRIFKQSALANSFDDLDVVLPTESAADTDMQSVFKSRSLSCSSEFLENDLFCFSSENANLPSFGSAIKHDGLSILLALLSNSWLILACISVRAPYSAFFCRSLGRTAESGAS